MAATKLSISRVMNAIASDTIDIPAIQTQAFPQQTTTGTTASKLVDTAGDFVTRNIEKGAIIYNDTDGTVATVTAIDSATVLSISADIMATGELYRIFTEATPAAYIYIGTATSIKVTTSGGDDVIISNAAVGWHPVNITRLWVTGTTTATTHSFGW